MFSLHGFTKSGFSRPVSILVLLATYLFAVGCNNTCFFGVVNPPNNSLTVVASTPPPACSLSQPTATVKVAGNMAAACSNCAASQQVSHVYLYLSGIELHPSAVADENSPDWQELAPELSKQPQLVDLVEDPASHDLAMPLDVTGHVPAGTYYQLRLRLAQAPLSQGETAEFSTANPCAASARASCLVDADGSTHALQTPEGNEYLCVQVTSPLNVHAGHLNQLNIQFHSEWSLTRSAAGAVELAPFVVGEVVGNANLPIGALN